jgi:hypothetical protein
MEQDYSNQNFQNRSFENKNLANANFSGSDLRGADFSGADLTGADLTNAKTGITPLRTGVIFFVSLLVSLLSGYVAMLAGATVQVMLKSGDEKIRAAGILSMILILGFVLYYYWKGGRSVIRHLFLPIVIISVVLGLAAHFSGLGTGKGMAFLILSLILTLVMLIVGTIARATAGVLSSTIIFILVAVSGSLFSKSVGGGLGATILAISCGIISKRALGGAKGFEPLLRITSLITSKWGTSFRNATLSNVDFSGTKIRNADFTNADLSGVNWETSKKINCTPMQGKS